QLKSTGQYDDTYIIFTSDNGVHLGEHRWSAKVLGYEPAIRVPLIISGPGLPKGVERDQAVTMVDLAATIADLAGVEPGLPQDGESLIPLATGAVPDARDRVVPLEAGPLDAASSGWLYRGVRTDRYTLLEWGDGSVELYDRRTDPHQVESVAGDPAYADIQARLDEYLTDLQGCAGEGCLVWLDGSH
nr:sulfatase-like hydrolase/transferase [Nocardioidaceae bacterium]